MISASLLLFSSSEEPRPPSRPRQRPLPSRWKGALDDAEQIVAVEPGSAEALVLHDTQSLCQRARHLIAFNRATTAVVSMPRRRVNAHDQPKAAPWGIQAPIGRDHDRGSTSRV